MKGIRLLAKVSLYENGILKRQERGEVQFTEQALSGICIFNLSAYCDRLSHAMYTVALDLLPDWNSEQVYAFLWELYALRGTLPIEEFFTGVFQRRVGLQVLKQCGFYKRTTIDRFLYIKGNRTIGIFFESMEISSHRKRGLEERTNFLWWYYIRRSIR